MKNIHIQSLKLLAGGLCIACARSFAAADTETKTQPNIILIMVDDMGYADVSCYSDPGDEHVKTPNIDKIADAGMKFTDGYVSGLQCAPTRAGLLSGKYQQRFGFYHNWDVFNKVFLPHRFPARPR